MGFLGGHRTVSLPVKSERDSSTKSGPPSKPFSAEQQREIAKETKRALSVSREVERRLKAGEPLDDLMREDAKE